MGPRRCLGDQRLIPAHAGKTRLRRPTGLSCRAHPRSRGENRVFRVTVICLSGSSPLTRGKPSVIRVARDPLGLIPAHAGKTSVSTLIPIPRTAHPRSRGENGLPHWGCWLYRGSSPLTRGKPLGAQALHGAAGLIPAHAGKTCPPSLATISAPAHPRSRGENSTRPHKRTIFRGSSPLTRGKPSERACASYLTGLIPAHAGKTSWRAERTQTREAHPRSRGENYIDVIPSMKGFGSSPLTRGKRGVQPGDPAARRLIPAHAGKTAPLRRLSHRTPAHPRSRGENASPSCRGKSLSGSSPLTRGKRGVRGAWRGRRGLIPAHAGKTGHPGAPLRHTTAHPRSRGENGRRLLVRTRTSGSSPLTRGKRLNSIPHAVRHRLIPAHAGKTGHPGAPLLTSTAHPRSRGENVHGQCFYDRAPGSSPLTRGKPPAYRRDRGRRRLIPAHAGKTMNRI